MKSGPWATAEDQQHAAKGSRGPRRTDIRTMPLVARAIVPMTGRPEVAEMRPQARRLAPRLGRHELPGAGLTFALTGQRAGGSQGHDPDARKSHLLAGRAGQPSLTVAHRFRDSSGVRVKVQAHPCQRTQLPLSCSFPTLRCPARMALSASILTARRLRGVHAPAPRGRTHGLSVTMSWPCSASVPCPEARTSMRWRQTYKPSRLRR